MLLTAANSAGGTSTLDTLIAIVILVWALAGAAAVLGWVGRRAKRRERQPGTRTVGVAPRLLGWLRAKAARDRILGRFVEAPEGPGRGAGWTTGNSEQPGANAAPVNPAVARGLAQQVETDIRETVPPPANPGAKCSPETLEPLGEDLDISRRLAVVEARLAPVLGALPRDRWVVERYVLLGGRRIPFLVLGETGVFAVWALYGLPLWREIPVMGQVADDVKSELPGYSGTVHAGVCRALTPDLEPRWWCRTGEPGAWVMGLNWVVPWLEHFGPEHGLGVKDIECLRALAGPRWGHGVTDVPPSAAVPEFDELRQG